MTTLEKIEAKSVMIREAAQELKQRILDFETYLCTLKGRVETEVIINGYKIILKRQGKDWELHYDNENESRRLIDAPLVVKIKVAPDLPLIFEAIFSTQNSLQSDIEFSIRGFDQSFARMKNEILDTKRRD